VIVFGATGYTGRLVCRALQRRNVRFAIAGADARKVAHLASALGGVEHHVVDLGSSDAPSLKESLRRLLDRRLLVCSCAGPFLDRGEPLLAAAAELGVHYVDVSAEQPFTRESFTRHDPIARASKACVVPSMAFATAPADWAADLLAERLGGTLDELDVLCSIDAPFGGAIASRGTIRAALGELARDGAAQHIDGSLRAERDATRVRTFVTLEGTCVTGISLASSASVVVPAHVKVGQLRTYHAVAPLTARALHATRALGPAVARLGRGAIDRLAPFAPFAASGPETAQRAKTRFEIIAEARRGEAQACVHITGVDPYAITAEIQAHAAEAALAGNVTASGVVAPSVGYPALAALASLADVLRVEVMGDILAPVRPLRSLRTDVARTASHLRALCAP
jgi:short subunit dehydrogenase-like uncharacterized protein